MIGVIVGLKSWRSCDFVSRRVDYGRSTIAVGNNSCTSSWSRLVGEFMVDQA